MNLIKMKCNNCNARLEIEVEEVNGAKDYDTALFKANKLYCDDHWSSDRTAASDSMREAFIEKNQEKKRELCIKIPKKIFMSAYLSLLNGKNCEVVRPLFSNLGFTNITFQQASASHGLFDEENTVDHILKGGKKVFTADNYFDKDSPIIIYYYKK